MNWKLWGTAIVTTLLAVTIFVHQTSYGQGLMRFSELFQLTANAATVLGIPIAILVYLDEMKKERKEREYATFDALDEKYLEFLNLCITKPRLDLYYIPLKKAPVLSEEERIQQYAMFEILISLMERAYLMYGDQSSDIKKSQWDGWDQYMIQLSKRPIFKKLWPLLGDQFDVKFMDHMNKLIKITNARRQRD